MKRKIYGALILLMSAMLFTGLIACNTTDSGSATDADKKIYSVVFLDENGVRIGKAQEIGEGEEFIIENAPEKAGYSFIGWLYDDKIYDFEAVGAKKVFKDMTFRACYAKSTVTVSFYDGETLLEEKQVTVGNPVDAPSFEKTGYTFNFWAQEGSDSPFDFNKPISKDIKLVANYNAVQCNVKFVYADGTRETIKATYGKGLEKQPKTSIWATACDYEGDFKNLLEDLTVTYSYLTKSAAISGNTANFSKVNGQDSYAYLAGSGRAVYLKAKLRLNGAHQGIVIYTGSDANSDNATIGFQYYGYAIRQDYAWKDTKIGKWTKNSFLGVYTTEGEDVGEKEVDFFIIDGKLYVVFDGANCFEKPLTLSDLNDAFTSDAVYHIGLSSYEKETSHDVVEIGFGAEAVAKFGEACVKDKIEKETDFKNGYYLSTNSQNVNSGEKYKCTDIFTKDDIPVGSVIYIADGWKYRPEGWVNGLNTSDRPVETDERWFFVTEDFWKNFDQRAFNVSKKTSENLSSVTRSQMEEVFKIYVPVKSVAIKYDDSVTILNVDTGKKVTNGSSVAENTKIQVTINGEIGKTKSVLLNEEYTGISITDSTDSVTGEFIAKGGEMVFSLTAENIVYKQNPESAVKNANEPDQNILYDNGMYYRTIWAKYSAQSPNPYSDKYTIAYTTDLNNWSDESKWGYYTAVDLKTVFGDRYVGCNFAPDLFRFNGKYYIIGSARLTDYECTTKNGYEAINGKYYYMTTLIFVADSPLGEYALLSRKCTTKVWTGVNLSYSSDKGGITPATQNCIDASLYVENGVPYLVYSDEWCNYKLGVGGGYSYARLETDGNGNLTGKITGAPKSMFKIKTLDSESNGTTDAIWMHKTQSGELLAVYTTFDSAGYCVNYARASGTSITNSTWTKAGILYSKAVDGYNINCSNPSHGNVASVGGHANLFRTIDGQLYLVLHLHQNDSDGKGTGGWREPAIIALKEVVTGGKTTFCWGLDETNAIVQDVSADNYRRLAVGSIGEANISYSVNLDETARGGLTFIYTDGTRLTLFIGSNGAVYVNGEKVGSVTKADKYDVVFKYKKDLSTFTFVVNGTNLSGAAKAKFKLGSLRTIGLYTEAVNGAKNGKAAYKNVKVSTNTDGNALTALEITDKKNATALENSVTITGNGYSYLKGSGNAVYMKATFNITNDHQGITIYTDSVNGNNAQICFQHQGYSILKNYAWSGTNLSGIFAKNGLLGIPTANKGTHTVEYFIIEGKLYITYDGKNLFDKPLILSELNSAFTSDAEYHIGIYNYDGNYSLENSIVHDLKFGQNAIEKFNGKNK